MQTLWILAAAALVVTDAGGGQDRGLSITVRIANRHRGAALTPAPAALPTLTALLYGEAGGRDSARDGADVLV